MSRTTRSTRAKGKKNTPKSTPVFFSLDPINGLGSSMPSLSARIGNDNIPQPGFGQNYLLKLAKKHEDLGKVMEELENQMSEEESEDMTQTERFQKLTKHIHEAVLKADGDSSDSRWIFISHILKTSVTSGQNGRYSNVRVDTEPPKEMEGQALRWINAKSAEEWVEWEKRYWEERKLKDMVETWKKGVELPSANSSLVSGIMSESVLARLATSPTAEAVEVNPSAGERQMKQRPIKQVSVDIFKGSSPFGFSVVKKAQKSSLSALGKPGQPDGKKTGREKEAKHNSGIQSGFPVIPATTRDINVPAQNIHDLPPKSQPFTFSTSQLVTSTPKPNTTAKPIKFLESIHELPAIPSVEPKGPSSLSKQPTLPALAKPHRISSAAVITDKDGSKKRLRSSERHSTTTPKPNGPPAPAINVDVESIDDDDDEKARALKKARTLPHFEQKIPQTRRVAQQILTEFAKRYSKTPQTPKPKDNSSSIAAASAAAPSSPLTPLTSPMSSPVKITPVKRDKGKGKEKEKLPLTATIPRLTDLLANSNKGKAKTRVTAMKGSRDKGKGKAQVLEESQENENDQGGPDDDKNESVIDELEESFSDFPLNKDPSPPFSVAAAPRSPPSLVTPAFPVFLAQNDVDQDGDSAQFVDPLDKNISHDPLMKAHSSLLDADSKDEEDVDQLELDKSDEFGIGSFKPLATSTQHGPWAGDASASGDASLDLFASTHITGISPIPATNNSKPVPTTISDPSQFQHQPLESQIAAAALLDSQQSKDSWDSIYAPGSLHLQDPGSPETPTSSALQRAAELAGEIKDGAGSYDIEAMPASSSPSSSNVRGHPPRAETPNPFERAAIFDPYAPDYCPSPMLEDTRFVRGSGGSLGMPMSSAAQLNIAVKRNVDEVNRILEKDLFSGWLKDSYDKSDEEQDRDPESSP